MSGELTKAINELNTRLQGLDGQVLRAKGANIVKVFSQEYPLDVATTREKPLDTIIFDFKSIVITDGTDNETYLNVLFDRANGGKQIVKMKNNASYNFEFLVTEVTIFSPAQSGKKITVLLSKDGVYTTGALINSGVVYVAVPTTRTVTNPVISAGAPTLILAANVNRKRATFQNNTGASGFVGGSGVSDAGGTRGIEVPNGATVEDSNTAALYFYSVAGGIAGTLTVAEET